MINFLATFAYYFQLFIIGMTTLCGSLLIILVLLMVTDKIIRKILGLGLTTFYCNGYRTFTEYLLYKEEFKKFLQLKKGGGK